MTNPVAPTTAGRAWGTRVAGLSTACLLAAVLVVAPTATAFSASSSSEPPQLVVKVRGDYGCSVDRVAATYQLSVDDRVLASRLIYRAHAQDPKYQKDAGSLKPLVDRMKHDSCVRYAEVDRAVTLNDEQFHSWTVDGAGTATAADWTAQPARSVLRLGDAHQRGTGADTTVAVLDTGVDPNHEVFEGRVLAGFDYIDDDGDAADSINETAPLDTDGDGHPDEAVGHGTFVAGMVAMVAPDANILPLRVLDSDGSGTVFSVAEAVFDAVAADVQVINLSFGTAEKLDSAVMKQALEAANRAGIVIVAAAGNGASRAPQYPASVPEVWSVGATDDSGARLAGFSNRGGWVDVATLGSGLVGPLPEGLYGQWSGTSLSAPLVAGQVALVRALAGEETGGKQLAEAITKTCRKLAQLKDGTVDVLASLEYVIRR